MENKLPNRKVPSDPEFIDLIFTYQSPTPEKVEQYRQVATAAANFYRVIENVCPRCADVSHAKRLIRDARMWANAAIALDGSV